MALIDVGGPIGTSVNTGSATPLIINEYDTVNTVLVHDNGIVATSYLNFKVGKSVHIFDQTGLQVKPTGMVISLSHLSKPATDVNITAPAASVEGCIDLTFVDPAAPTLI